jgi:hypothetical protein
MFPIVDTKSPGAVADAIRAIFHALYPSAPLQIVDRLFSDIDTIFTGHYLDYQAIDIGYHDYEHTLQATLCFALIFQGRHQAKAEPRLSARDFEIGLAASLLHDTGYLKLRSDTSGSSAKYTHVHVLRSGAFAASYVPSLGFNAKEAETVANAIHCTGHAPSIAYLHFNAITDQLLGCMLVTADYLGQMAALDYCDELEILYKEFLESDLFYNQPKQKHLFESAEQLQAKTPLFWNRLVLHKLQHEFGGLYRYLASPFPVGVNPYIEAVERNIEKVKQRIKACK